mgnify:CR=1 FL=1
MKKRFLSLCAAFALGATMFSFGGCSKAAENTRMTVDINPSVELMVDKDNKVVSVTALNDDAAIILQGTAFVGKTSDEAVKGVVEVATETGYIVKGEVEVGENNVKISVSGDTKWAKDLYKDAEKKVNEYLESSGIKATVERVDALKTEALKQLAKHNSTYTEEEIAGMNDEQLLNVCENMHFSDIDDLYAGRVETAQLVSEEVRQAYFAAKEYEISLATSTATKDLIYAMNSAYAVAYAGYGIALDTYSAAIKKLDDARYNALVSPDSAYQKLLVQLREKKAEILAQKQLIISIKAGNSSVDITIATGDLTKYEAAYDKLVADLEAAGKAANDGLTSLIELMKQGEKSMKDLQAKFPADITDQLNAKASEIDAKANKAKDEFFARFEEAHKADFDAMNKALADAKAKLIENVEKAA